MDILKFFPNKSAVIAEFKQTSLASPELSFEERLMHDSRAFCDACGDLVSLLVLRQSLWTAGDLRSNTLLVLATVAFDEVMKQIQGWSSGTGDEELFKTVRQLQSLFEWLDDRADVQEDVRQAVALIHALSVRLRQEIFPTVPTLQVHFDLKGLWAAFLPNSEKEDWDTAFEVWSSSVKPLAE